MISLGDTLLTSHEDKALDLTNCYQDLLASTEATTWNFNASDLYPDDNLDLSRLVAPFSEADALHAIKAMNINSVPGPDRFGPAWYVASWSAIKNDIMLFLVAFHSGTIELDRINRVHIVLPPKCDGATTPKDFRPVSL